MLAELVGKLGGKVMKFAVVTYRAKKDKSLARHSVILAASFDQVYLQDIAVLEQMLPKLDGVKRLAAEELLNSRRESLKVGIGNNPAYVHAPQNANTYVMIPGLPGVKVHTANGTMYVMGLSTHKVVIEEGEPKKPVNSSEKTLAKREIEKQLQGGNIRQFILTNVNRCDIDGETLVIDGE